MRTPSSWANSRTCRRRRHCDIVDVLAAPIDSAWMATGRAPPIAFPTTVDREHDWWYVRPMSALEVGTHPRVAQRDQLTATRSRAALRLC